MTSRHQGPSTTVAGREQEPPPACCPSGESSLLKGPTLLEKLLCLYLRNPTTALNLEPRHPTLDLRVRVGDGIGEWLAEDVKVQKLSSGHWGGLGPLAYPLLALTHCPPAGQWPPGLRQADGRHPEGRGHPHQARLGREGATAGPQQPAPR
jgi:hypothetical protein